MTRTPTPGTATRRDQRGLRDRRARRGRRGRRREWAVLLGAGAAGALVIVTLGAFTGAGWPSTRQALLVELAVLALCALVLAAVHRARISVLRLATPAAPGTRTSTSTSTSTTTPVPHPASPAPARQGQAAPRHPGGMR